MVRGVDRRLVAIRSDERRAIRERHVLLARGRDYRDVPPLKGIVSGAPSTTPAVSVELTRHA
jgi:hypothetical protein